MLRGDAARRWRFGGDAISIRLLAAVTLAFNGEETQKVAAEVDKLLNLVRSQAYATAALTGVESIIPIRGSTALAFPLASLDFPQS